MCPIRGIFMPKDPYLSLHPYKAWKYKKLLVGKDYISPFNLDSFSCKKMDLSSDGVQRICQVAYRIFRTKYTNEDFQEKIIANKISLNKNNKTPIYNFDFRLDTDLKTLLKGKLSILKNKHSISDDLMNMLVMATWDAFIKFKANHGHEMISSNNDYKVKCKQ